MPYFKDLSERERHFVRFKWEFMRRDKEVRAAIDKARVLIDHGYDPLHYDEKVFREVCVPIIGHDKETNFMLADYAAMLAYEKCFDKILEELQTIDRTEEEKDASWIPFEWDFIRILSPKQCFEHLSWDEYRDPSKRPSKVTLTIDFDFVNSIDALKREAAEIISWKFKEYERMRKEANRTRPIKPAKKLVNPELILQAGDLFCREGLSIAQIARDLCPGAFALDCQDDDPRRAMDRVENYVSRYKDLTQGGWVNLVFP